MNAVQANLSTIFPGGKAEIEEWSKRVYDAVEGRLSLQESQFIFGAIRGLIEIANDKSESRMVESILSRANGKISREDACRIFMVVCAHARAR